MRNLSYTKDKIDFLRNLFWQRSARRLGAQEPKCVGNMRLQAPETTQRFKAKISYLVAGGLLFLLLISAREPESRIQQISAYVDEIGYQLHHHKVEIDLFHERLKGVEDSLRDGLQEISKIQSNQLESARLRHVEEGQKALLADLKNLKTELMNCITKQMQLEKSMHTQMKEVQLNLQKALALLGGSNSDREEENYYIVKAGDSLGLIAQNLKVSLKSLKEANQLSNDNIYVGQKLRLP